MHTVTTHGETFHVDQKTWRAVLALLNAHARCRECQARFSPDLPRVSATLCVVCFIERQHFKGLRLSYLTAEQVGDEVIHLFRDPRGWVHTSDSLSDWATLDKARTDAAKKREEEQSHAA